MDLEGIVILSFIFLINTIAFSTVFISIYSYKNKNKYKKNACIKNPSRRFYQKIKLKKINICDLPLNINLDGNINVLRFIVEDLHLSKCTGNFMLIYLYKWVLAGYVKYTNGQLNFKVKNIKDVCTYGENTLYEFLNKTIKMDFRNKKNVLRYLKENEKFFYRRIDRLQMEAMSYLEDHKLVSSSSKVHSVYNEKGYSYLEKVCSFKKHVDKNNNIDWSLLSLDEKYLYLLIDGRINKLENISKSEIELLNVLSNYKKGYTMLYQKYMIFLNKHGLKITRTYTKQERIMGEVPTYKDCPTTEELISATKSSKSPVKI